MGSLVQDVLDQSLRLYQRAYSKTPDPCEAGGCNLVCEYSLSIQMELLISVVDRRPKDLMESYHQGI